MADIGPLSLVYLQLIRTLPNNFNQTNFRDAVSNLLILVAQTNAVVNAASVIFLRAFAHQNHFNLIVWRDNRYKNDTVIRTFYTEFLVIVAIVAAVALVTIDGIPSIFSISFIPSLYVYLGRFL